MRYLKNFLPFISFIKSTFDLKRKLIFSENVHYSIAKSSAVKKILVKVMKYEKQLMRKHLIVVCNISTLLFTYLSI